MDEFNHLAGRKITTLEKDLYKRDGFVLLKGIYHSSWIEYLKKIVDSIRDEKPIDATYEKSPNEEGVFFIYHPLWTRYPEFKRFSFYSPSAEIAAELMGSRTARLENDQIFVKEPGKYVDTYWHQDSAHHCLEGEKYCCVWLTLDEVDEDQCLAFVRGSHRWGVTFGPRNLDGSPVPPLQAGRNSAPIPEIKKYKESFDIVKVPCAVGDCIVFDMRVLHGIDGPESIKTARRAVTTRWVGDDISYKNPIYPNRNERKYDLSEGQKFTDEFPQVWPDNTGV